MSVLDRVMDVGSILANLLIKNHPETDEFNDHVSFQVGRLHDPFHGDCYMFSTEKTFQPNMCHFMHHIVEFNNNIQRPGVKKYPIDYVLKDRKNDILKILECNFNIAQENVDLYRNFIIEVSNREVPQGHSHSYQALLEYDINCNVHFVNPHYVYKHTTYTFEQLTQTLERKLIDINME